MGREAGCGITEEEIMRLKNVRMVLSLGFVSGIAALPTGVLAALPASCADIHAANPAAADGMYVIVPGAKLFTVYCHDMAGVPAEYLPLVNTGGPFNFSTWAAEYHTPAASLSTHYTMVRLNPATLLVDIGDQTFATSSAGPVMGPGGNISSMPYATAAECRGFNTSFAAANVDLTGTPFVVDDSFVVSGWYSAGSANGPTSYNIEGNSTSIPVLAPVVNLTGGGFCGGTGPGAGWEINDGGGFDLQLKYIGPAAAGPDACKKDGWKNFGGIFRNQGDCVSFFATGGRNPPAGGN
jgi:hypothetical protein